MTARRDMAAVYRYNRRVTIYDLCLGHNRRKLQALQDALTTQKWKAFAAIPAILHHNFSALPGAADGLSPHGFVRPHFAVDTFHHAGEFFPEFRAAPAPPRKQQLLGLYAMGSVGTCCFTSASDIDFWVIHGPDAFAPGDRRSFERKLREVETWAMEKAGLEVHFYIHELTEIQAATFSYDTENAGEFGPLLKEEFLRTCVHVAGLEPSHWGGTTTPPLELGPIPHLSTEQYLSACLTQLEKAVEKPFKSALKIALLRRLASRPADKLPAEVYHERVAMGAQPDAYMLLLEYLLEHFQAIGAPDDHTFLKGVLYLKMIAEETSAERVRRTRDRLVAARFQSIGAAIDLDRFDAFFEWPFEARIRFSDGIARYLQASLREISSYLASTHIDPSRVRALTRKILLRRGAGSVIEYLTFADVPSRGEQTVTFIWSEESREWILSLQRFAGRPDYEKIVITRTGPTVVPLMAFALRNNLINRARTEIRSFPSDRFPRRAAEIIDAIPPLLATVATPGDLEKPAVPDRHLVIVEQHMPKDLESRAVTVLTRNSWGVAEFRAFTGPGALEAMFHALSVIPPARKTVEVIVDQLAGPDSADIAAALAIDYRSDAAAAAIVRDQGRYLLLRSGRGYTASSPEELLLEIGSAGGTWDFRHLPSDTTGQLIELIMRTARSHVVSLFQFEIRGRIAYFVVDAMGGCDAWTVDREDARFSYLALQRFLINFFRGSMIYTCHALVPPRDPRGPWSLQPLPVETNPAASSNDLHFKLIDGGQVAVRFGSNVIERHALHEACSLVAQLIRAARRNNRYYPPFLTGLNFPASVEDQITVPDATRMKRDLEEKIGALLSKMY
jgi:hypothetical protein